LESVSYVKDLPKVDTSTNLVAASQPAGVRTTDRTAILPRRRAARATIAEHDTPYDKSTFFGNVSYDSGGFRFDHPIGLAEGRP
jgi:hypothetical protein